jgi:hypothetical protein
VAIFGGSVASGIGSETQVQQIVPVAATLSNFHVRLNGAPGTGDTYTFTVRRNGVSSTTVTCSISGGSATSCSDTTLSEPFAAGDLLSIMVTVGGTPTGRAMLWTAQFN